MDQDGSGQSEAHGTSLPESAPQLSLWPFLVAAAVLIFGLSLFWAANEDNSDATVPVVAGTAALLVVSALAWALEGRVLSSRTRDEERGARPAPRHTQVITFLIAEGELDAARAEGGILHRIDNADGDLRAHPGFVDLRLSVTAEAAGPSQALAETVWASREAFVGYDEAKDSLLDALSEAGNQVVPGSVQAFDMDVVRDTKESPARFTLTHIVTALGALVVGGFVVGIIAGAVENGTAAVADGGGGDDQADPLFVVATDNKFDQSTLSAAPGTEVTFTLQNDGAVLHNLAFYDAKGGNLLSESARGEFLEGGAQETLTFTTPGPGEYYFQCDLHPTEMFGTFTVVEGGPGGAAGGSSGGGADVIATDIQFNVTELTAKAGEEVSMSFENQGAILHNLAILTEPGGEPVAEGARGEFINGGEGYTLTFTAPEPGEYTFICEIHPQQMVGKFIVE
ncbi:MAG: cupredoxin domain-containing protein [Dehalococcoidia bacterium]